MTGFKSGASSSPYNSDDDDSDDEGDTNTDTTVATADSETRRTTIDQSAPSATEREQRPAEDDATNERGSTSDGLPWIYKRSSITDGRSKTVQLHLQDSTRERQTEALSDAESELGESVKKADLREAALLVGMDHIDEVADVLREWGYDVE